MAIAALPIAFAAGLLAGRRPAPPRGWPIGVMRADPVRGSGCDGWPVSEHFTPLLQTGEETGYDDLDGDNLPDCWALWEDSGSCCTGGQLEVRHSCGDQSWRTDTAASRYDHLQIVAVPTAAGRDAVATLATALWGDVPLAEDGLASWLIETDATTPDPWLAPTPGTFAEAVDGQTLPDIGGVGAPATSRAVVVVLRPAVAARAGLIDRELARDTLAVLVAHVDGGEPPEQIAACSQGGSVWQAGGHLAWTDGSGTWRWVYATPGPWWPDEVACVGTGLVLVRETHDGDVRVIAIDAAHRHRATLAGVQMFSPAGDAIDLAGDDDFTSLDARVLQSRVLRAR